MWPLKKRIETLKKQINETVKNLDIDDKRQKVNQLEAELAIPEVWHNPAQAQAKSKQLTVLQAVIEPWTTLQAQVQDINELAELGDESLADEFEVQIKALEIEFLRLQKQLLLRGKFDDHNAILRLSAGAGGVDAQDWTAMLERMYLRWAEKTGFKASVIERSAGEEAGVKTSVIEIVGPYAYGKLSSEHGVHRLVRLSPFNSDNLRQTSFALVEVLPQIEEPDEVSIDDKDLKIDAYRSGGHGGQSVNTTDSAVRVTHIPTGITVAIQNERSQLQNKDTALKILRSKLAQLQLEQHVASLANLKANESANWGSQIRNYVMHPYSLVKDTRTKYEDRNIQGVLDGKIDEFINHYLTSKIQDLKTD
jgi:peptide chain release factor 2